MTSKYMLLLRLEKEAVEKKLLELEKRVADLEEKLQSQPDTNPKVTAEYLKDLLLGHIARKNSDPEEKAQTCIAQHIQAFADQHNGAKKADLAAACRTCPYVSTCSEVEWAELICSQLPKSKVKLSLLVDKMID